MPSHDVNSFRARTVSERGISFILVGLSLFALMSLTAFVLDYGVMWLARRQAQNAADAGAFAGAIARLFDEPNGTPVANGPTEQSIAQVMGVQRVFSRTPTYTATYNCPAWSPDPPNGPCVRVDAFVDGSNGSPTLPTYFAKLWGQATQGVKATATARCAAANYSKCLKPWMIPDKWIEVTPPATDFNGGDTYTAPGYTLADVNTVLTLKEGDPSGAISPSDYYEIDDAATYVEAIVGCRLEGGIGSIMQSLPGNRVGPTIQATTDLIDQDPSASWDYGQKKVVGGCTPNCPLTGTSPRLVPIAMFSPSDFAAQSRQSGRFPITIVNMMGFFILCAGNNGPHGCSGPGVAASTVMGVIAEKAGDLGPGGQPVGNSAFLKIVQLIQ